MTKTKFKDLPISEEILNATVEMGFETATEVQASTIPLLVNGADVVAQSQTGTGKTASFGIPMIDMIDSSSSIQGLVLCPTRELALQVVGEMKTIAQFKKNIKITAVYGGAPISKQIKNLQKGTNIVVGTPGRIIDLMDKRHLKLGGLKMACLDEADEMLNMGFVEDIEKILDNTPDTRQTILFSATMPRRIKSIARKYQNNPETITVTRKNLTVDRIKEFYVDVKKGQKKEVLKRLMHIEDKKQGLIFCNTKRMVDQLTLDLQSEGFKVDGLHGDLKQSQRDRVMGSFRQGKVKYLIATDVAARGIDVDDVEIVYNYDLPQNKEYYVHRIGRTGRAGRQGQAVTFVYKSEVRDLRSLERYTKSKMNDMKMPSYNDLQKAKSDKLFTDVKELIDNNKSDGNMVLYKRLLKEEYSEKDIIMALLNKVLVTQSVEKKKKEEKSNRFLNTGGEAGMARLFVNIGEIHRVRPGDLLGCVAGEANIEGKSVGTIDIFKNFSFVEVPVESAVKVINSLKGINMKGVKLNVEPANGRN